MSAAAPLVFALDDRERPHDVVDVAANLPPVEVDLEAQRESAARSAAILYNSGSIPAYGRCDYDSFVIGCDEGMGVQGFH